MHSNRIISIQRRAKRRILALAIIATALAGYGAMSAFAQDERPTQMPFEKMSRVPGVKAVGIRLINSNGKLPPTPMAELPAPMSLPSAPIAFPPSPSPMMLLPATLPTSVAPLATLPSTSFPTAPDLASGPTYTSLPSIPKKSDLQGTQPTGKVLMKLNGAQEGSDSPSNASPSNASPSNAGPSSASLETKALPENPSATSMETVNVRVIQSRSMGQPAKMPPFLVEQSGRKVDATSDLARQTSTSTSTLSIAEPHPLPAPPTAIRMSLGDSGENVGVSPPKDRAPQLVKIKPTQLEHTVTLALSTEIESRKFADEPESFSQPVEVDSSLVPHSISNGAGGKGIKNGAPQAIVSDAVSDAFVALAPPARDLQIDSSASSSQAMTTSAEQSSDRSRRRFDPKPAFQAPIATVDLESLAATTMDLAGRLVAIAVQDENVCKVLHNDRTVSLVGNQAGTTLVQIWTSDLGDKPQVVRVNVTQQGGKVQATTNAVKDIKQVIAQSFPRADVSIISKEDGSIEVRGTTESEESARRILELVRKLYLVPVKDKLTVSN